MGVELKVKTNIENKQKNYNFAIVRGGEISCKGSFTVPSCGLEPVITLYKMS